MAALLPSLVGELLLETTAVAMLTMASAFPRCAAIGQRTLAKSCGHAARKYSRVPRVRLRDLAMRVGLHCPRFNSPRISKAA